MNWWTFLWDAIGLGLCRHLPLVAMAVFVALLAAGAVGKGIGIPKLVWHERPWPRFVSGFSLTLLVGKIAFVGYLLDKQQAWRVVPTDFKLVNLADYLAGTLALVALLTVAIRLYRYVVEPAPLPLPPATTSWVAAQPLFGKLVLAVTFPLGVVTAIAASAGLVLGAERVVLLSVPAGAQSRIQSLSDRLDVPAPAEPWLHGIAALFALLLVLGWIFGRIDKRSQWVTPIASLATLLGLLASAYGFGTSWFGHKLPFPALVVIFLGALLWLSGSWRYKLRFEHVHDYRRPVELKDYAKQQDHGLIAELEITPWLPSGVTKAPLVVACTSGGASRAAAWTAAVLQRLNERIPGFSYRVRLITGASGGMVGAAYHVAALQKPGSELPCRFDLGGQPATATNWVSALGADGLSTVMQRFVYRDLASIFLPIPTKGDRGRGLEDAWRGALGGKLDGAVQDLRAKEREGWCPSLVFSPMLVEDGRRLLVTNLDLGFLAENGGATPGDPDGWASRSEIEFFKLFPGANAFKLSTAARMNASFPFVSPAATLPTVPRRRVVDAGYYDDYGVNLAAAWIHYRRDWLRKVASRVVLIQIRDSLSQTDRRRPELPKDETSRLSRGLEELTSPVLALLSAREGVMSYRNDEQVELLENTMGTVDQGTDAFFTTATFENPVDVAMSWYLTAEEQHAIVDGLDDAVINEKVVALERWWMAGVG